MWHASSATSTTKAQHEMEGRLLLNVVVGQGPPVLQLLAGKDEALLIRRNAFLILDLLFHVVDRVRTFHLKHKKNKFLRATPAGRGSVLHPR